MCIRMCMSGLDWTFYVKMCVCNIAVCNKVDVLKKT